MRKTAECLQQQIIYSCKIIGHGAQWHLGNHSDFTVCNPMNTMDYYRLKGGLNYFFPPLRIVCTSHCISSSCICVQMYTTLLMLSSFLFSLARIHDWHLITQSLKTSHWALFTFFFLPGLLMASGQRVPLPSEISSPSLPPKWARYCLDSLLVR